MLKNGSMRRVPDGRTAAGGRGPTTNDYDLYIKLEDSRGGQGADSMSGGIVRSHPGWILRNGREHRQRDGSGGRIEKNAKPRTK